MGRKSCPNIAILFQMNGRFERGDKEPRFYGSLLRSSCRGGATIAHLPLEMCFSVRFGQVRCPTRSLHKDAALA